MTEPAKPDPAPKPPDIVFVLELTAAGGVQRDRDGFRLPGADERLAAVLKFARRMRFRAKWGKAPAGVELSEKEPDAEVPA